MKKTIIPLTVFLLSISTASNAVSTTYDFAAEGNFNSGAGEAGYSSFNTGTDSLSGMPGGLTVTASNGSGLTTPAKDSNGDDILGTAPDSTNMFVYEAYIDANTSSTNLSKNAGLGVCHIAGSCAGKSDDNHMQGEYIHMLFDSVVEILSLDITGDHKAVESGAKMLYSLDSGASWASLDIGGEIWGTDLTVNWLLTGKTLDYTITPNTGQMYLSAMTVSPVPVPAAIWLFGSALIGFIGISRRTNLT